MKRFMFSLLLVLALSSTSHATTKGCMIDTAKNQKMVEKYIIQVMKDKSSSHGMPAFYQGNCQSRAALMECFLIIDETRKLAALGMADKIEMPKFSYDGSEK